MGKNISLLRLDSGFHSQPVLEFIETKAIHYIIAACFYEPIRHDIARLKRWVKKARPNATGKQPHLFKEDEVLNPYRYAAYITKLTLSAADVWRLYRGRADAENRMKELKYDSGFDRFNPDNFFGTQAALGIAMPAYNLMALHKKRRKWFAGLWEAAKTVNLPFEFYNA